MTRLLLTLILLTTACGPIRWTPTYVVDGDTIMLRDNHTVRYIGIDAPERGECMYAEALVANRDLLQGREVELTRDTRDHDIYGRWLRYVVVDGIMVNEEMVRRGLARAVDYPPDTANSKRFHELEATARSQQLGIWGPACR